MEASELVYGHASDEDPAAALRRRLETNTVLGEHALERYVLNAFFGPPIVFAGTVLAGSGMVEAFKAGSFDWPAALYPVALIASGIAATTLGGRMIRSRNARHEELTHNLSSLVDAVEQAERLDIPVSERTYELIDPKTVFLWWDGS